MYKQSGLHSTHHVDGLGFDSMADVLHVPDRTQQVHAEPQFIKVLLVEQFDMWRHKVLWKIITEQK